MTIRLNGAKILSYCQLLHCPTIDLRDPSKVRWVGKGAIGSVFRYVAKPGITKPLAVKVIEADDPNSTRFLAIEAYYLLKVMGLSDEIVGFHGVGKCITRSGKKLPCLVLDFIEGASLELKGKLDPLIALKVIRDIAAALHKIHEQNLVYRDMKSDNIMVNVLSQSIFSDFGDDHVQYSIWSALDSAGYAKRGMLSGAFSRVDREDFKKRIRPFLKQYSLADDFSNDLLTTNLLDDAQLDRVFDVLKRKSGKYAVLIDFAYMRRAGEGTRRICWELGVTAGFVPIEVLWGGRTDKRSDISSLGIVLYKALVSDGKFHKRNERVQNKLIFDCKSSSVEYANKAKRAHNQLLHRIDAQGEIAKEIKAILRKMLASPMYKRFQSCNELIAALDPIIDELELEELKSLMGG